MGAVCKCDLGEWYEIPRWVVTLSNGEKIFQDGDEAWYNLYDYVQEHSLKIVEMYLQFRSHHVHLEPNADGYYFAKGVTAGFGMGGQEAKETFFAGVLRDGKIFIKEYLVPEIESMFDGERDPSQSGKKLIRNVKN